MGSQIRNEDGWVVYHYVGVYDSNERASWYLQDAQGYKTVRVWCPYATTWRRLVERSTCSNFIKHNPSYIGCSITSEWLRFSNFKKWVDSQPNKDWMNCHLDKDLLVRGNKLYSPETVVFVTHLVNTFITDNKASRGNTMIGVSISNQPRKYASLCRNPFTLKQERLGYFYTELEAHKAWQAKKHEYACRLADLQEDPRVADALRLRYAPDKDWTKA